MSDWKAMQRSNEDAAPCASLAELCSYWDWAFVERAYWSVLGRAPDPDGGSHFLNEVRAGVSKLTILLRLRESAEGRKHDSKITGLDEALSKHRQAIRPYTGAVVRMVTGREGDTKRGRAQRAIVNHLAATYPLIERLSAEPNGPPQSQKSELQRGVSPLGVAHGDLGMFDHLLMRVVRIEAALKRIEDRLKAGSMTAARREAAVRDR